MYKRKWSKLDALVGAALGTGGYLKSKLPKARKGGRPTRPRKRRKTGTGARFRRPGKGVVTMTKRNRPPSHSVYPGCKIYPRRIPRFKSPFYGHNALARATFYHKKLCNGFSTEKTEDARAETSAEGQVSYWNTNVGGRARINGFLQLYKRIDDFGAVQTVPLTGYKNAQMVIKFNGLTKMKNNTGVEIHVTIYKWVCRKNTVNSPEGAVNIGLQDYCSNSATTLYDTNTLLWPEQSLEFKQKFKVLKKFSACIEPGKSLEVPYSTGWWRVSNYTLEAYPDAWVPGITTGLLVRQKGGIVHGDDISAVTNVNYGSSQLDIMHSRTVIYGFYEKDNVNVNNYIPSYDALTGGGVAANMEGLKIEDNPV